MKNELTSIEYEIKPIQIWPEGWDRYKPPARYSPFSATWSATRELLDRELSYLKARQVTIQIDVTDALIRRDGMLRQGAKVDYPGVILGFDTKGFGGLSYPCNAFKGGPREEGWQQNVRAIALGLEALRKVERYGIANRGQQYAGFRELGSGIISAPMTEARALELLLEAVDAADDDDGSSWEVSDLFRLAASRHHPDVGGDEAHFKLLVEARDRLES